MEASGETDSIEMSSNEGGHEISHEGNTMRKAEALEVTVVLQKVLEGLPFTDLLSASLVCKLWCREARSVVKDNRFCILNCRSSVWKGENVCSIISNISKEMEESTILDPKMFKGIKIERCCAYEHEGVPDLDTATGKFLIDNLMNLKYFHAVNQAEEQKRRTCSVNAFAAKLFLKNMATIETLSFYPNSDVIGELINRLPDRPTIRMPFLKAFCPYGPYGSGDPTNVSIDFISEIIDEAPKLKRIDGDFWLNRRISRSTGMTVSPRRMLPKNGWQLVRDICLQSKGGSLYLPTEELRELAGYNLQLEHFSLYGLRYNSLEQEAWYSIRTIVDSSQFSLNRVSVSFCVLKALAQLRDAPRLANVDTLWLTVHPNGGDEGPEFTYSDGATIFPMPFIAHVFPQLKKLSVCWTEWHGYESPNCGCHGNPRRGGRGLPRFNFHGQNPSLTALLDFSTSETAMTSVAFAAMAQCSPNVTSSTLHLSTLENLKKHVPQIWKFWPNLQTLELKIRGVSELNLDSALLGIPIEEAKNLQTMDEDFLSAVKIVPVKPAITNLKTLKKLTINISYLSQRPKELEKLQSFFLSKLFVILGVRKMPHLEFILEVQGKELGAYINLIPKEFEPYLKKK